MLSDAFGHFVSGLIFGAGASLAAAAVRNGGSTEGLHDVTKGAVKAYLAGVDRARQAADGLRQRFDAVMAEAEAELAAEGPTTTTHRPTQTV